jgi:hypothetical protein
MKKVLFLLLNKYLFTIPTGRGVFPCKAGHEQTFYRGNILNSSRSIGYFLSSDCRKTSS